MKHKKIVFITVLLGLVVFLYSTASYSGLTMRYQRIIRVAYMNGFMEAAKMDPAELSRIREETDLLKVGVEKAADMYVDKVYEMNSGKTGSERLFKSKPF